MKVYIAGSYGDRIDLASLADRITRAGHEVVSTWTMGPERLLPFPHGTLGLLGEMAVESMADEHDAIQVRAAIGEMDLMEIQQCDVFLMVNRPIQDDGQEESTAALQRRLRGGRHVEFGYALALGKRMILLGERENIFHWADYVSVIQRPASVLLLLDEWAKEAVPSRP